MPHGPYAGESIFDPMPLHPAPPGLPTMPNGSVDLCALITPHTTTTQATRAGRLAKRISNWAGHSLVSDGIQYQAQSADGIVRAFPFPPGQMPRWHGPANLMQPVHSVPIGQVDVIFALAKGNWHCGNPICRKPLDPWAAQGAHNAMCVARVQNYIFHDGLRGPTAAENNLKPEFACFMCANKGEA